MKKSFITYLYLLAWLVVPLQTFAQEKDAPKKAKTDFTLNQAIDYALQHNNKIKNASLSIIAAEKQKWETIATGLPQISGNLEYSNAFIRPAELSAAPAPGAFSPSFFFPKHKVSPSITLTQLIFDGSYLVGLQSVKVFLEISKNAKLKTDVEIKKAVIDTYSNILLTQKSIDILEKNIVNIGASIKETKALLDNGFVEEEDLEQLQLTLNDLENNKENLKQILGISKNALKLLMGHQINQPINITDSLNNLTSEVLLEGSYTQNIPITQNIDYKIALNNTESKRLLYKLEIARKLPTVNAFLNGGYFGQSIPENDDRFEFFEKQQQWFGTATVGLQIYIPILSSFKGVARIRRAKIDWEIAQNELDDLEQELNIQIKSSKTALELAIKTLKNKKQNLDLAERIEKKNNTKYKEGVASSFELRQAQMQLYSSQNEYLQAMVSVINKNSELNALKN